jgi:hypothetical protein
MGERPMGRFENRFVRAVAFSIVVPIAVVAVGVLQRADRRKPPSGSDQRTRVGFPFDLPSYRWSEVGVDLW